MYPIPGIAWIPLAILWFGVGFTSTVFVIFFSGNLADPVQHDDGRGRRYRRAVHRGGAGLSRAPAASTPGAMLLPGSLPYIITGMRLTYGVGWRVIVGAEMISSITGLGFLIDDARWQLRPDIMVGGHDHDRA